MPEFYYEVSDRDPAYRIDEISQQMLVYLSSGRTTTLQDLAENVSAVSESELQQRIAEHIGPEAAGLVAQSPETQETLGDNEPPTSYELTEAGERFVRKNKATLAMPADFKRLTNEIEGLREDVIEIRDSMHRVDADELSERLSAVANELDSLQTHISKYD